MADGKKFPASTAPIKKEGLVGKLGGSVKKRWQDRWIVVHEDGVLSYRKWRSEEELLQGSIKNLTQCGVYPLGMKLGKEKKRGRKQNTNLLLQLAINDSD